MKYSRTTLSAFSLVEVTLTLGVAAFCLVAVIGLLPVSLQTNQAATQETTANGILSAVVSDIRTVPIDPKGPGNSSKQFKLYFPKDHGNEQPRFLYFSNEGSTGTKADHPTTDTVFYATIEYMPDPIGAGSRTATLMHVKVAWPYAGVTPPTQGPAPAGFVETFLSLDWN